MGLVMRVCDQVVVLDFGAASSPRARREEVAATTSASIEAYLGAPA